MAGYQSIFGSSQPTATPSSGSYRSIFAPSTPTPVEVKQQAVKASQQNEQQQIKQHFQSPAPLSPPPAPKQSFLGSILAPNHNRLEGMVNAAKSAIQPVLGADKSLIQGAKTIANLPSDTVKAAAAEITGNKQAQANATNAANKARSTIGSFIQTPYREAASIGVGLGQKYRGGQPSISPDKNLSLFTGKAPIPTVGTAASQTKKQSGTPAAVVSTLLNASSLLGPLGIKGFKGGEEASAIEGAPKERVGASPEMQPNPTAPAVSKPKIVTPGEEGSVAPGQAIKDVQDLLAKHQASTKFSGDLEKNITQSEGNKSVIAEDAGKLINDRTPISNTDKQTLQDYRDAKAAGLTPKPLPEHLQAEDADVTALNKATQAHDAELARLNGQEQKAQTIESRDASTYTHREAQNKGTALDYVAQGTRKNPLSVSGLSKTTPASKARVFHAITDEEGNRRIVAIKNSVLKNDQGQKIAQGKLVQAIDNGGSENLGKLKLNTNQDFLDNELKPYQTKVKNLQKEYDALSKVKTKGGVSETRMDALAKKAALLEDPGNLSKLTKSEAKSLREATLKFQELARVKKPGTNTPGRLQTLNRHLVDLHNKVNDIYNKYDPETLDKKIFVGKDGKKYTIGQATQSEITKATGQKYYIDPKLLALKNYAESRTALENARFIQSIKDHPDFDKFASEPGQTAPKGWRNVKGLDQFRGYKFEPKTAEVLSDIVKNSGGDEPKLLDQAGKVLRQTIVYFPLKHSINEGITYAVDRGLSALVNPLAYKRGAQSLVEAYHEVTNQGPKFQAAQKAGLHTVTGGDKVLQESFAKEIKNLANNDRTIADVAKHWGTSPKRLYSALQNLTVWQLQDVLNMARVIERTKPSLLGKGDSLEGAVAKTQRYNLQYSVPSRVGPRFLPGRAQRSLANTLSSPKVFFGRYRYDLYRILSNTIKDTVDLKSLKNNPRQNVQALDKLAAMALGTAIIWPLVDKGIQKVAGNKNAYMKAPGVLELPSEVKDIAQGKKNPLTEASNQVYLSSAITQGLDLKSNRDSFTGKQIYDPNSSIKQQFIDVGKWIGSQQAPAQQFKQGTSNKDKIGLDILLSLTSARLPKNAPEVNDLNSLKFDSLPGIQSDAKAQAAKGDINGAISTIKQYDTQVLAATKTALKAAGQPIPDDKTLEAKLKQQGFYYNPTRATVQGWASPSAKPGTLQSILGATPAPKKGQPGYLQYRAQQKQKSLMSKFKNPADKLPVIP